MYVSVVEADGGKILFFEYFNKQIAMKLDKL